MIVGATCVSPVAHRLNCRGIDGAAVESGSGRSKIAPTVRDESAVTPHPTRLTPCHLPLKGKAGGRGGGIGLRADVGIGPYGEERSAYADVGAGVLDGP